MSPGPIRRAAGAVGLVALAPTAVMLMTDSITPSVAAVRAAITLVFAVGLARLAAWWLESIAQSHQRAASKLQPAPQEAAPVATRPIGGSR